MHRFFYHSFQFSDPNPILSSFIGDLFAGLCILLVGTFLVPKYLEYRQKPKLLIKNRKTRDDIFLLTRAEYNYWEGSFSLAVYNAGPVTQRHWYWHLLIPEELQPNLVRAGRSETLVDRDRNWIHFLGSSSEPIYSHKSIVFPHELKVKTTTRETNEYKIYYYFSTEFGTYPPNAGKLDEIVQENPERAFENDSLGSITIRCAQS